MEYTRFAKRDARERETGTEAEPRGAPRRGGKRGRRPWREQVLPWPNEMIQETEFEANAEIAAANGIDRTRIQRFQHRGFSVRIRSARARAPPHALPNSRHAVYARVATGNGPIYAPIYQPNYRPVDRDRTLVLGRVPDSQRYAGYSSQHRLPRTSDPENLEFPNGRDAFTCDLPAILNPAGSTSSWIRSAKRYRWTRERV